MKVPRQSSPTKVSTGVQSIDESALAAVTDDAIKVTVLSPSEPTPEIESSQASTKKKYK